MDRRLKPAEANLVAAAFITQYMAPAAYLDAPPVSSLSITARTRSTHYQDLLRSIGYQVIFRSRERSLQVICRITRDSRPNLASRAANPLPIGFCPCAGQADGHC